MRDKISAVDKFQKLRQDLTDRRRVLYHAVRNMGEHLDPVRDRDTGVHKGGKPVHDLPAFHPDRAELDNGAVLGRKAGRFKVKDYHRTVERRIFLIPDIFFFIVHEIAFHPVDHFQRVVFFQRMEGVRKRIDTAVVGDGHGTVAKGMRRIDQLVHIRDPVQHGSLGMAVKFDPFHRGIVFPGVFKTAAAL